MYRSLPVTLRRAEFVSPQQHLSTDTVVPMYPEEANMPPPSYDQLVIAPRITITQPPLVSHTSRSSSDVQIVIDPPGESEDDDPRPPSYEEDALANDVEELPDYETAVKIEIQSISLSVDHDTLTATSRMVRTRNNSFAGFGSGGGGPHSTVLWEQPPSAFAIDSSDSPAPSRRRGSTYPVQAVDPEATPTQLPLTEFLHAMVRRLKNHS